MDTMDLVVVCVAFCYCVHQVVYLLKGDSRGR
jgi:hypothetical protein